MSFDQIGVILYMNNVSILILGCVVLSYSVVSNSSWLMDCNPPGSSVDGDSADKNTGVGCHALLQEDLPNPGIKFRSPTSQVDSSFFLNLFIYFNCSLITLQYCSGFCHTLTWISHGCTCEPPSHHPPHPIHQGHPSAPALSALSHALNLDWQSVSHMVIYMFQCYSLKSSHPRLLPQSPKVCFLHLCLFYCLMYGVIVTIFLNFTYMH